MSNIMVDLETMGTSSNAAIVAIGAVAFDRTGLGEEFYCTVNLASSVEAGMVMDADTVMWWLGQSAAARKAITKKDASSVVEALSQFTDYVMKVDNVKDTKIWGNGASFDNVILGNAYDLLNMPRPWKFWNDRCFRTLKNMFGKNIDSPKPEIPHHALYDAKAQAEHFISIMDALEG